MIELPQAEQSRAILVINSGSSSVKFALFTAQDLSHMCSGMIDRIGLQDSHLYVTDAEGAQLIDEVMNIPDHKSALSQLLEIMDRDRSVAPLAAVGHRIVHGGLEFESPVVVTEEMEARLRKLVPLAPLHQPHNVAGITAVRSVRPDLPQVACFDTAFHRSMPTVSTLTALPRKFYDEGIRRFGFHGLSYEYIVDTLRRDGINIDGERIMIAHLGNGASMCALKEGRSIETTMGFSTLAGLPMGTRCGDLDPGIVLYLIAEKGLSVERIQHLLYEESGLLGLSALTPNMQDLLKQLSEPTAIQAIEFYCYQARRHLTALTASLSGLDRLVFTGGIGANAPQIRAKICEGLEYLGIKIDAQRNSDGERVISAATSAVAVEAFQTHEELMIARHVQHVLWS
jgi:acetate kinase